MDTHQRNRLRRPDLVTTMPVRTRLALATALNGMKLMTASMNIANLCGHPLGLGG